MKKQSKVKRWLTEGNDCEKCPCCWSSFSGEDWDGGCHIRDEEELCRLPLIIRKIRLRRAMYLLSHQYDGMEEWYTAKEKVDSTVRTAISDELTGMLIGWRDLEGIFYESDREMILSSLATKAAYAYSDATFKPRERLRTQWRKLIAETISIPVDYVKSYVLGG